MSRMLRLVTLVVVVLVTLTGARCDPPKPTAPGQYLGIYFAVANDFASGSASAGPFAYPVPGGGTAAQALTSDGSVALAIANIGPTVTNFYTGVTTIESRLENFAELRARLNSTPIGTVELGFLFDVDNDGSYLDIHANGTLNGVGDDAYALCGATGNSTTPPPVDDLTTCELFTATGEVSPSPTVEQLKAGMHGITAGTYVLPIVLLSTEPVAPGTDASAVVRSLFLNGNDVLVP